MLSKHLFFGKMTGLQSRLTDGDGKHSGLVEVVHGGVWAKVCAENWTIDAASLLCRQLGFPGALSAHGADPKLMRMPKPNVPEVRIGSVVCPGGATDMTMCKITDVKNGSCPNRQAAATCDSSEFS